MLEKKSKKNRVIQKTGLRHKIIVYESDGGAIIGRGWVIVCNDGSMSAPELYDLRGEPITERDWFKLQITEESDLVVVAGRVQ